MKDRKLKIQLLEGGPMILATDPPVALCRCGLTSNAPYCSGSHVTFCAEGGVLPASTLFIPLATIDTNGGD